MSADKPQHQRALDYATPPNPPQSLRGRRLKTFLIATSTVLLLNIAMAIALGTSSKTAQAGFAVINFPAIPCVFGLAMLGGAPMGEADPTPFERIMPFLLAMLGSILWGIIAVQCVRRKDPSPHA